MLKEAIQLLTDLSNDIPDWCSECNCYSVKGMWESENKIEAFLDRYHAAEQSNDAVQRDEPGHMLVNGEWVRCDD